MYLLYFLQGNERTNIALFDSVENGKKFVEQIPGYKSETEEYDEFDLKFEYETIKLSELPDYIEIEYNGNIVPITKFMFTEDSDIEVYWERLFNFDQESNGMLDSATRVDAYSIDNYSLKEYIDKRERKINLSLDYLRSLDYECDRAYKGSEDGEAIIYKKKDDEDWSFLTHVDPSFVEGTPDEDGEFNLYLEDLLSEE